MDRVNSKIQLIVVLLLAMGNIAVAQQILVLNGGTQLHGRYDGGNADTILFIDEHGNRHKFNISEVQSLIFNPEPAPPPPTASAPAPYAPYPNAATYPERGYADTDVEPAAGWTRSAMLPAGTEIVVRTVDPIDVRQPEPHRHFLATVERDVMDANGNVVIPRGSPAHLIVHSVGGGDIAIDLRSVSVNGRRYILNSEDITNASIKPGLGANRRTGAFVGAGALLGTVLGAVAGGGKGAAVGALAGGAAGAGGEVLTRGHALHIPPETILRFRLDHPVYLYD